MKLDELKQSVRTVCNRYPDREERSKRLFLGERAVAFVNDVDREFSIKTEVSRAFQVSHSSIYFCGSAQLGFSIHKDTEFTPRRSDLDIACIDANLFQKAWMDALQATRAFSDPTAFGRKSHNAIATFKDMMINRPLKNSGLDAH